MSKMLKSQMYVTKVPLFASTVILLLMVLMSLHFHKHSEINAKQIFKGTFTLFSEHNSHMHIIASRSLQTLSTPIYFRAF